MYAKRRVCILGRLSAAGLLMMVMVMMMMMVD